MNIMEPKLLLVLLVSFFVTFFLLPSWIRKARKFGLVGKDMNKYNKSEVAEAGGIVVIAGFVLSVLLYIALKTFYFKSEMNLVEIFALLAVVLMLSIIGLIDNICGWRIGLGRRFRVILCLFAAIPLMVINAGDSTVSIPLIGEIAFGWIYTLFLIPLGIAGASTTFNFLAGFNGLEAGQGILILSALSIVAYSTGITWLALMGLCMVFSLLAFWIYNKFPARVFPGDVITYPVGGMIALMAILGNMEVIALFFFIPYIIELILKVRGRLKMQSFGKPNRNNGLEMPYNKIYGLEHFAMYCLKKITKNGKVYEKDVVYFIHIIQIIIIGIGFVIFRNSIF